MALFDHATSAPRNRLLAALPPEDLARLRPRLEAVPLTLREVLSAPGKPITAIYFPETGYVSMLAYLKDGDVIEVAAVGNEGIVGMPILLGDDSDDCEAMVQNPGTALRMDAAAFRAELDHTPAFRSLLLRSALFQHRQVVRTAACNGRHHTDQRLARWLLVARDRAEGGAFAMTHELLAMMLGVRRAGITVAASQLQRAGLIHYERGRIEVTDRPGLEAAACECYGVARRALDHLLGSNPRVQSLRCH
ncbi:Crp/Fnr family transcriptional regulator [Roseicella aerolata]|uniref:Crp/Fnr family transcriptional regulator n=1 Tax=Roseicella aerolata TaxID=2883479 RepID=A0A9X1IKB1_9PROT|nr:Crp/Fnr family transcriptional regulator [Roseicella aerolata]MCB4824968.1 Crp/Fnr family transcriptional regulator [Roseicella aerolata]